MLQIDHRILLPLVTCIHDADLSYQKRSAQKSPCQTACMHHLNELGWLPRQCCAPGCESTCFQAAYERTSGKACKKLHGGCCCSAALLPAGGKGSRSGGCFCVTFSHSCCPACWSDSDSMSDCLHRQISKEPVNVDRNTANIGCV